MKKLLISSDSLKLALAKLGNAIDNDIVLPVLQNLLCKVTPKQLELIGSNLNTTIIYKLECESSETFDFLISYKFLNKIVHMNRHCPLEIEAAAKSVKVKGPIDVYEFKVADKIKDYPQIPEVPEENSFEIKSDIIRCLATALETTGKNDKKPQLAFVLMELAPGKITVASTDGAYMVFSKEFDEMHKLQQELLLNSKVIKSLASDGLAIVRVSYSDKAIRFDAETFHIVNIRSEEKFVNFRKVFPDDWPGNLTIERSALVDALTRCSIVDDQLRATKMNLEKAESLQLSSDDHMLQVNVSVPVSYNGTVKSATINSERMLKLLNQVEHEEITFAIHDSSRAIVLTAKEDAGYKGMIMPIASKN